MDDALESLVSDYVGLCAALRWGCVSLFDGHPRAGTKFLSQLLGLCPFRCSVWF
jgi:hypothetical protein